MRSRVVCAAGLAGAAILLAAAAPAPAAAQRWAEVFRDEPPYGTEHAELGASVSITDTLAVAGAPGSGGGRIHVYTLSGAGWGATPVAMPASIGGSDRLGASVGVAVHLTTGATARIAAGAPEHSGDGTAYVWDSGAGGAWGMPLEVAPPTSFSAFEPRAFGASVDVSGDYLVVGAPDTRVDGVEARGAIFVFHYTAGTWTPTAAWGGDMLGANSHLGAAVAIRAVADPGRPFVIAAGAPGFAAATTGPIGMVVILSGDAAGGVTRDAVVLPRAAAGSELGVSVDVAPGVAVAGAPGVGAGVAYRFTESVARSWTMTPVASVAPAIGDRFGASVAISGGSPMWVGAPERASRLAAVGEVFGFATPAPMPSPLQPNTTGLEARFGTSVSATSHNVIVGAPGQTSPLGSGGAAVGAVVIFALVGMPCMDATACPGTRLCVDGVCCDRACGGGADTDCMSCATTASTGVCVNDPGHVCRPASAACDPEEACAATGRTCPADVNMCADFDAGLVDAGDVDASSPNFDAGEAPPPPLAGVSFSGGGGCACRAAGGARAPSWLAALALGVVVALAARAARRRRG